MSAHTPGPWRTASYDQGLSWKVETQEGRRSVASYVAGLRGECEANARLIAAAPDLLALVVKLADACRFVEPTQLGVHLDGPWWLSQCEALIAKAEGK